MKKTAARPQTNGPTTVFLPSGPRSVNMLSYNIFLRPPGIKNNQSDYKDARLALFGENCLKNFDIVGFQELFAYGTSRQSKMLQYARKAGYEYYVASPSKGLLNTSVDGGLMILSRYPIVKTDKLTFKKNAHSDRMSNKGAIYAKIAITPSMSIHVFNTHLKSSVDAKNGVNDPSVIVRLHQICALKEFMDDNIRGKAAHEPIFLMGDMGLNGRVAADNGKHSEDYNVMIKILRGDINIAKEINEAFYASGGSPGQKRARQYPPIKLGCRDLNYDFSKEHPITYGDVESFESMTPREIALTSPDKLGSCVCADYMLQLNFTGQESPLLEIKDAAVDKFLVAGNPFSQLSGLFSYYFHLILII